jgi:hypothetical protein
MVHRTQPIRHQQLHRKLCVLAHLAHVRHKQARFNRPHHQPRAQHECSLVGMHDAVQGQKLGSIDDMRVAVLNMGKHASINDVDGATYDEVANLEVVDNGHHA